MRDFVPSKAILKVLSPGLQTSLQGSHRAGLRHQGFPSGGPADHLSAAIANSLLGNEIGATVLECSMSGPTLQAMGDIRAVLSGASVDVSVDGIPIALDEPFTIKKDGILKIGACETGLRVYLAIEGGFVAPLLKRAQVMPITDRRNFHQQILQNGDLLMQGDLPGAETLVALDNNSISSLRPSYSHDWLLRALPGPECPPLGEDFRSLIQSASFDVQSDSNRMGVRLMPYSLQDNFDKVSDLAFSGAVYPGTLQWPVGGTPILLGCDGQTTGGYPRILQVLTVDLPLIGQLRPKDRVWFQIVDNQEAQEILRIRTLMVQSALPNFTFC